MRRRRYFVGAVLAVGMSMVVSSSALGYTILNNNFPGQPNGCTNQAPYWCERWPMTANYNSTYVYIYLDPSLTGNLNNMNLAQAAQNAMGRWNAVPAAEPFLNPVGSIRASTGYNLSAGTFITMDPSVAYPAAGSTLIQSIRDLTGQGDPNTLVRFYMGLAVWPRFVAHQAPPYPSGAVDGDAVLVHELGHSLALGHTYLYSVMYPVWDGSSHDLITPTTTGGGDVQGLQFLYNRNFCLSCPH
jgi:hypothetical protein